MKSPIGLIAIFVIAFVLGRYVAVQAPAGTGSSATAATTSTEAVRLGGYKFIAPLLMCSGPNAPKKDFAEYQPLNQKLNDAINGLVSSKKADQISVYFRELDSGHWTGVNENDEYEPASLLKVPFLIAYYKEAESDPSILSKPLAYDANPDRDEGEYYRAPVLAKGTYTVDDLIKRMIVYSGNNSLYLLSQNIDAKSVIEIYSDLGVTVPTTSTQKEFLTPKLYASFFRVLYNASYLSRDSSERALSLLSQTTFNDGIVAGLPSGTLVAHKFGERPIVSPTDATDMTGAELHDCGIVYYPDDPYLLCIMTRGKDFDDLAASIATVSRTVYQEVDARHGK